MKPNSSKGQPVTFSCFGDLYKTSEKLLENSLCCAFVDNIQNILYYEIHREIFQNLVPTRV